MTGGYTKSELEDAVLKALYPLSVNGGGSVRTMLPYRGEASARGLLSEALQMPAVFVAYASSAYRQGPYLYAEETAGFNVIVVCRASGAPGAFELLKDVRGMLCGSTLGLEVAPVRLTRESALFSDKETDALSGLYSITQRVRLSAQGQ